MGKKWIVGLMILAALWAMTGCGKQEMIRCEYTNETAGFTLSLSLIHISEPTRRVVSRMPSSA